ncbi:MAG: Glyceraldehyde-3-phosphate dehydrogenase [Parcubacteria group bacterium GW2011_GWC1_41_7]|nr:MAG: Glyceraldehyde-3-phosphate dehydrogenase [Parcubacteria group bacterium GW2011_GWC1_41_7]
MNIAINGFGRIGRVFFRQAFGKENITIVAINDLSDIEDLAYLLKYDTTYGRFEKDISISGKSFMVDGKEIKIYAEKDPIKLPWKDLNIDIVIEATGVFSDFVGAHKHIEAGAKRVVITAPAKDTQTCIFTPGLEDVSKITSLGDAGRVTSNASCTTNAVNPVLAILDKVVGVEKATLNTVHGYTATQSLIDSIAIKDVRRGRAAALNIVPSTTGAADATARVLPRMKDKFGGISIRVPVITGSLADITFIASRPTTVQEINSIFEKEVQSEKWKGIVKISKDSIVSSDVIGEPYGAIIDTTLTQVVGGNLVKVFSWYDNEWGYCAMLLEHIRRLQA